jgi:SNF family Na+-dependent transporter
VCSSDLISGLSAAYFLSKRHKVDLYEQNDHFGGHSYTYDIKEENKIVSRLTAAVILGLIIWVIGIGSVFSFNIWEKMEFIGTRTFMDSIIFLTFDILMPLGGMLVAIFAGWFFKPKLAMDELSAAHVNIFTTWRFFIKFVSPVLVAAVFMSQLFPDLPDQSKDFFITLIGLFS